MSDQNVSRAVQEAGEVEETPQESESVEKHQRKRKARSNTLWGSGVRRLQDTSDPDWIQYMTWKENRDREAKSALPTASNSQELGTEATPDLGGVEQTPQGSEHLAVTAQSPSGDTNRYREWFGVSAGQTAASSESALCNQSSLQQSFQEGNSLQPQRAIGVAKAPIGLLKKDFTPEGVDQFFERFEQTLGENPFQPLRPLIQVNVRDFIASRHSAARSDEWWQTTNLEEVKKVMKLYSDKNITGEAIRGDFADALRRKHLGRWDLKDATSDFDFTSALMELGRTHRNEITSLEQTAPLALQQMIENQVQVTEKDGRILKKGQNYAFKWKCRKELIRSLQSPPLTTYDEYVDRLVREIQDMHKAYNRMVLCGMEVGGIYHESDVEADSESDKADKPRKRRRRSGGKKMTYCKFCKRDTYHLEAQCRNNPNKRDSSPSQSPKCTN